MDPNQEPKEEHPLDLEEHEGEGKWDAWRRRLLFVLLIGLCIAFAAPTFGSCSGAFGSGGSELWGTFRVGERTVQVREDDFRRASLRLQGLSNLMGMPERIPDEQVWKWLMLDAAAREEGVHVSDEQVRRLLERFPQFQTNGKFDEQKYFSEVKALTRWSHEADHDGITWALKLRLRVQTYTSVFETAFDFPSSRAAYDEWKKANVKLTVDYVVQPFEPLKAEARALPVTEADLLRAAVLPQVVEMRTVPARRGVEAAYVRVRDVTDEQRKAMEEFAQKAGIYVGDQTLEVAAWKWFFDNQQATGAFTRDTWLARTKPAYDKALAEWEARPDPKGEKPKDPAAEPWPQKAYEAYDRYWKDLVVKEVLARDVLRYMAKQAAREGKSFTDLLPQYEAMGVRVVTTPEPLTDADIQAKFPEGLGKDTDVEQTIRSRFRPPAEGAQFAPQVADEPIPTTRLVRATDDRGWVVLRWTAYEPARERPLDEVKDKVAEFFREWRAHELAPERLKQIRDGVAQAGGDVEAKRAALRKSAEAAGLDARTLRRFNRQTPKPRVPDEPTAAARVTHRNRVQDDYEVLAKTDVGAFRDPVLVDDANAAAYLMLVVEKHEPAPQEMSAPALEQARWMSQAEGNRLLEERLSYAELRKRFSLELTEAGRKATETAPRDEE